MMGLHQAWVETVTMTLCLLADSQLFGADPTAFPA